MSVSSSLAVTVDGAAVTDADVTPYSDDYTLVWLTGTSAVVLGFGFKAELTGTGQVYVTLDPFYTYRVRIVSGSCRPQTLQGYCDGPPGSTRLEKAPGSPAHYLVRSVTEGQWETSIDTLDPGSRQIAVEEGRDLVVVLILVVVVDL